MSNQAFTHVIVILVTICLLVDAAGNLIGYAGNNSRARVLSHSLVLCSSVVVWAVGFTYYAVVLTKTDGWNWWNELYTTGVSIGLGVIFAWIQLIPLHARYDALTRQGLSTPQRVTVTER